MQGSGALFWIWLSALREKLTAVFGIVMLVPTALYIDYRMALILFALASAYTVMNVFVMRKTSAGQRSVESYSSAVSGRVGDVIGNVSVVQSYARLQREADELRKDMRTLLAAQFPVLTWWGLLTVLHRSAATLTMVAILLVGAYLTRSGELSVGEIVSFVAFSTLLISRLDQLSSFFVQLHRQAPVLETYFSIVDAPESVEERPDALPLTNVRNQCPWSYPVR